MTSDTEFYTGDALEVLRSLPAASIDCCVTSPPYYGLRDYGADGQLGLEPSPEEYVDRLVAVFAGVRDVLVDSGTLWLNLGDCYNAAGRTGHGTRQGRKQGTNRASAARADLVRASSATLKPKDLLGVPWRVAFALQADGWYLRSAIVWAKRNPMPESVADRPTRSYEHIFLLAKGERYYYDPETIREPVRQGCDEGANARDVWTISTQPYPGAHFATFPKDLARRCLLAGCPAGGTALDPFGGSGTVAVVAREEGRRSVYVDLNPDYTAMARDRVGHTTMNLFSL